jgi:hypothetical protein
MPLLLIYGHMLNSPIVKEPCLAEPMEKILKLTPQMVQCISNVCQELQMLAARGASIKKITGKTFETII